VIKDGGTEITVIHLWAEIDFIVEITYPKIRNTILHEKLLKLTRVNWVQYYISDNHNFLNFLNHVQSPEEKKT
jgi:hypothetical protein